MSDHEARVRKLVTTFNTLSSEGKNVLLEQVEALKRPELLLREACSKTQSAAAGRHFEQVWRRTS
ncbi:MAG: hypothetical protein Pg6A_13050 [Termitinemataceae bacterium]|jgi:fructose-specific component phosphotransferase system IIB-like protein|nr:MAG: hypothetical protein Pg6A_13050 [Termitinemataceae bacterium]